LRINEVVKHVLRPRRGIRPAFKRAHVVITLLKLLKEPIGRIALSRELGIGEASSRTLLNRLRELGIVKVDNVAGALLTSWGREVVEEFLNKVKLIGQIDLSDVFSDNISNYAGVIIDGIKNIESAGGVLKVRDLFVRYGAEGALILYYVDNELMMPLPRGYSRISKNTNYYRELMKMELRNGDAVLIAVCKEDSNKCMEILIEVVLDLI